MKKFIRNLIILAAVCGTLFFVINYFYSDNSVNLGTVGEEKNDAAYIENDEVPENIRIAFFGNSHAYYGFDNACIDDALVSFNFSLSSQSLTYDYLIMNNYRDKISPGATVFICISHDSFYGIKETSTADFAAKNKRYYHFLKRENIKEYDNTIDLLVNLLPALTSRSIGDLVMTIFGVDNEEDYWSWKTDAKSAVSHGKQRYEYLIAKNVDADGNRIHNEEEIQALYDMISLCRTLGAEPVLISTPLLAEYTDVIKENDPDFYTDYFGIINEIVAKTGVSYYDYEFDSRFINNYDLFMNTDHLNKNGAKLFTGIVMDEIYYNKK